MNYVVQKVYYNRRQYASYVWTIIQKYSYVGI